MKPSSARYHLTFQKCGSQWIRDLLGDASILESVGFCKKRGFNALIDSWVALEPGEFTGPVYNCHPEFWSHHRRTGDRAVLVIRDPRDVIVSRSFSLSLSHPGTTHNEYLRKHVIAGMDQNAIITHQIREMRTILPAMTAWFRPHPPADVLVMRYEEFLSDTTAAMERAQVFWGWDISRTLTQEAQKRHAFETRSGRIPGQEDAYSHYRKASPGDWRLYWNQGHGRLFLELYPGVLQTLGYAANDDWVEGLPTASAAEDPALDASRDLDLTTARANLLRYYEKSARKGKNRTPFWADLHQLLRSPFTRTQLVDFIVKWKLEPR